MTTVTRFRSGPQAAIAAAIADEFAAFDATALSPVDTPVVSASSSATVTGTIFGLRSGQVTEVGSRGSWDADNHHWGVWDKGVTPGIDFYLTGTTIECEVVFAVAGNAPFWVFVDDKPVTQSPDTSTLTSPGSGGVMFLKVEFSTPGTRRVEIWFGGGATLVGWRTIRTPVTDVVTPSPRRPVVGFIGDSYYAGSAPCPPLHTQPFVIGRLLGVEPLSASYGGTGYVATGSSGAWNSANRLDLMTEAQPALIVLSGSVNDAPYHATLQAAAESMYSALADACPDARLIVFGVQPSQAAATLSASHAACNAALAAACAGAANVIAYHDMIGTVSGSVPDAYSSEDTYTHGDLVTYEGSVYRLNTPAATPATQSAPDVNFRWELKTWAYTGTGQSGSEEGDGTRDVLLSSDGVHPTVEGSRALAIHQAGALASYAATSRVALGAKAPQVTAITTPGAGTYTIPDGAVTLALELRGGGGGGGAGRRGAAGTVRCGGGPGGNGAHVEVVLTAAELLAAFPSGEVPYVVGAGAAGGAAVTTDDTDGNSGSQGGQTTFGSGASMVRAIFGNPGSGGTATHGAAGFAFTGTWPPSPANPADPTGDFTVNTNFGGSGAGGGITSGNVPSAGTPGVSPYAISSSAGSGGVVDGAGPTSGSASGFLIDSPPPGGGAASITTAAQAGADALPNSGRGGGGGGASLNGNDSGAGGAGGAGFLRVVAFF